MASALERMSYEKSSLSRAKPLRLALRDSYHCRTDRAGVPELAWSTPKRNRKHSWWVKAPGGRRSPAQPKEGWHAMKDWMKKGALALSLVSASAVTAHAGTV
jgi:hypothetical protein